MRPPNPSMADAINMAVMSWYEEIENYDFTTGKAKAGKPAGSVFAFTALVWKKSTKVGIGASRKSDGYIYIVVQFSPSGNYAGEFMDNVGPADGGTEMTHNSENGVTAPANDKRELFLGNDKAKLV